MKIVAWPFKSIMNKLEIDVESGVNSLVGNQCQSTDVSNDDSDNLRWIKITLNGVTLYGEFQEYALVDTATRSVQFAYNQTAQATTIIVPHFWTSAEFDPDFQVLLTSNGGIDNCVSASKSSSLCIQFISQIPIILFFDTEKLPALLAEPLVVLLVLPSLSRLHCLLP